MKKELISTIYLKDGFSVKSPDDFSVKEDALEKAIKLNDCGADRLIVFDLSSEDDEHEINLLKLREISSKIDLEILGGGNIKRLEDVKKLLYAGCDKVIMNASKPDFEDKLEEASKRFGKENIFISTKDNTLFGKDFVKENAAGFLLLDENLAKDGMISNDGSFSYIVAVPENNVDEIAKILSGADVFGVTSDFLSNPDFDFNGLKIALKANGLDTDTFDAKLQWSDLKTNSDGLIPCVVQDIKTDEVLMLAYMNEESFNKTLETGLMTYWSRSRQELWTKGMTSGHIQYVKSLTADCDFDTILAKVNQVGAACHTGAHSCFFNEIAKKEVKNKNPLEIFEDVYGVIMDRKEHPKEGSYTNYLFDKGLDKILKKVGEECTELVIAAKNPEPQEIIYEESDLLYHVMVLMAEKGVTWNDITRELAKR